MPVLNSYLEILPESGKGMPNLIGMHLEGPNFSPKQAGAQDPRRIYPPRPEEYTRVLEMMRGNIAKWSFAPELPGAVEFCRELVKYGVMPCIGHTDATYDEVMQVYPEGANCLTHFYSSMSGITRKDGYRVAGVIESGYILDDMWVEVIADGSHIPPLLLGMIFKLKDINKIMLVTDAMRGATMPDGPSILGVETECIIEDGIAKMPDRTCFAGSVATTDRLVRTVYKSVGMPICAAIKMMCENPARALGLGTKGRIAVGYDADIVIFDDNVNVQTVIVGGEIQQF
jgi:N-acetylglucosamine-6-phosphate deacetylase